MDWLIWVLIGITIFEFWRNFKDIDFSLSDFSPKNLLDSKEKMGYFVVLVFVGLVGLFNESPEFRMVLVYLTAFYCGYRYFKSGLKEKPKKEMSFFGKIAEFICLVMMSLLVGGFVLMILSPFLQDYERKQFAKEYQQQHSQSTNNQYQR